MKVQLDTINVHKKSHRDWHKTTTKRLKVISILMEHDDCNFNGTVGIQGASFEYFLSMMKSQ